MAIAPLPPVPPPPPRPADDLSVIYDVAQGAFLLAALAILYLMFRYRRERSTMDRNAAATAAFGLILCGRYAGRAEGVFDWIFVFAVGAMMIGLAYTSLTSDRVLRPKK